jgi:hypothetical protein
MKDGRVGVLDPLDWLQQAEANKTAITMRNEAWVYCSTRSEALAGVEIACRHWL